MKLFEFDNIYFKLEYKSHKVKEQRKFEGLAAYQGTVLGVKNPNVTFTHQNGKWSFSGWKMKRDARWGPRSKLPSTDLLKRNFSPDDNLAADDFQIPFDIDKAIELGSSIDSKGKCEELVDFVIDLVVRMQFEFELSMKETEQARMEKTSKSTSEPKEIGFTVKWFFSMVVKNPITGEDTNIATRIELQEFDFFLPLSGLKPTFAALLSYIWNAVLSDKNLSELGSKLLDPECLAKLVGVMALEKLGKNLIEDLVCRKPKGEGAEKLKEEAKKRNDADKMEKDKKSDKTKKELDKTKEKAEHQSSSSSGGGGGGAAGGAAGGAGAGGAAGPGILGILGTGIGIAIGIFGFFISLAGGGGGGHKRSDPSTGGPPKTPDEPKPSTDYGSYSLLDLIKLYVAAVYDMNDIKPEELKAGRLPRLLTEWRTDSADDVDAQHHALLAKLSKVEKSKVAAKQAIEKRMNLRDSDSDERTNDDKDVPGITAKFSSDSAESFIDIDLSRGLPLRKWVHPSDYQGVRWLVYLGDDKNDGPPMEFDAASIEKLKKAGFTATGRTTKIRIPAGQYRYKRTAHVWVRMHATEDIFDFAATKWTYVEVSHKPWLKEPLGIQLSLDGTSLVIDVPPVEEVASDWDISLVAPGLEPTVEEEAERKLTLFRAAFSNPDVKGPGRFLIDPMQLGFFSSDSSNTGPPAAVVARVRQSPWDSSNSHASLPTNSFQTLPVMAPPAGLKAEMIGENIVVSWSAGTTTQLNVRLFRKDTQQAVEYTNTALAAPVPGDSSRLSLGLMPEGVVEGDVLSVVASASLPPEAGTLCLLAETQVVVSLPLVITIEQASNWDKETEVLTLVVTANKDVSDPTTLHWQLAVVHSDKPEPGTDIKFVDVPARSLLGKKAILRTKIPAATIGSDHAKVILRTGPPTTENGTVNSAEAVWMIPSETTPKDNIGEITARFEDGERGTSDRKLIVSWPTAGEEGIEVSVTVLSETIAFKSVTKVIKKLAATVTEAERECVFLISSTLGVLGAAADPTVKLSAPSGTALICWCVVSAVKDGGNGSKQKVLLRRMRLDVTIP